jgi:hypothetical protein
MLLGVVIALLGKLNKAQSMPDFTWKMFIHLNWIATVTNILAGIVLISGKSELMDYIGKDFTFGVILATLVGMGAQLFLQTIFDFFSKKVDTKLGINKPE